MMPFEVILARASVPALDSGRSRNPENVEPRNIFEHLEYPSRRLRPR
jgi:hypothetical protein